MNLIPDVFFRLFVSQKCGLPNGLPTINIPFNEVYFYDPCTSVSRIADLALLIQLSLRYAHCSYLEIGTWRGESVSNVAQWAEDCTTIDIADNAEISKGRPNITHIIHDSMTFDFSSLNKKFDLIFVDGDHSFKAVKRDTQNVFKLLKDENSVIVWHDYGLSEDNIRWPVFAGIIEGCPKECVKYLRYVSDTMCAIYIRRKYP
jgi:hypothetical protein